MKFLLDTSVVSQYRTARPDPRVDAWLQRTDDSDLYISEITYAELWYGVSRLASGRKRANLEDWLENELPEQFFGQCVFFGMDATRVYGRLVAHAERNGFKAGAMDALIASIAVTNNMAVATLNRKDFERLGVDLVDF